MVLCHLFQEIDYIRDLSVVSTCHIVSIFFGFFNFISDFISEIVDTILFNVLL